MRDRTTIIITHSLALARRADRVVVLDAGGVVEEGPPEDLLSRTGLFRHLAVEQGLVERAPSPAPTDERLPAMPVLLDADAMVPVLARTLAPDVPEPEVRVHCLRYRPRSRLVVHYDVAVGDRWHHAVATVAAHTSYARRAVKSENLALARLVDGRSPAPLPLAHDAELGALIQWLPLDLALPALAQPTDALRRRLDQTGVDVPASDEPALLRYKPRLRAVLGWGDHVLKLYADDEDFSGAARGLREGSVPPSILTARAEAILDDLRLTVQQRLPGVPPPRPADAAAPAGALLAALHAAPADLPPRPPTAFLDSAAVSAEVVVSLLPDLLPRLDALLASLESSMPHSLPLVAAHGDFHARQLLECGDRLGVIDFDHRCAAPAAMDAAVYAAHLVRGAPGELERAEDALERLLDGYGARPPAVEWFLACAVLRRARAPFRYLDERWAERTEGMVAAAEELSRR